MQSKKDNNFFGKFVKKDYKDILEEILEDKFFGENAKSLLLEIIYKIETGYKDYETVKKDIKTKDEYIQNFLQIVSKKCKSIKIVKPNSEESNVLKGRTFIIKKEKGEIICLPIARKLLYAIAKLDKKSRIVPKRYYLLSTTISNLINVGSSINAVEPLRDFNGWSWTTVPREIESLEHNLIYQNILMLVGGKFCEEWIQNGDTIIDYVEEFEAKLEILYGKDLAQEIITTFKKISILLELKVNPKIKEKVENSKVELEEELEKYNNKEEYIDDLTKQKNKLNTKIKKIDKTINDQDLLKKEYVKRNKKLPLEKKIFSMRILAKMMIDEREELFKQMEEINYLLKPINFVKKQEELEKDLKILNLATVKNEKIELSKNLYKFQVLFLECFKIKIAKASTKQEIVDLIYRFRYYCLLPCNENETIFTNSNLQKNIHEVGKLLIEKATTEKIIVEFSNDKELNYKILKNIFSVRTMALEELYIKLLKEKDEYFIQCFDEKEFDKKIKLDIINVNKKALNVRFNKKEKLFS